MRVQLRAKLQQPAVVAIGVLAYPFLWIWSRWKRDGSLRVITFSIPVRQYIPEGVAGECAGDIVSDGIVVRWARMNGRLNSIRVARQGDSYRIKMSVSTDLKQPEHFEVIDGKKIQGRAPRMMNFRGVADPRFQVELLAAGCEVSGGAIQSNDVSRNRSIHMQWNVLFKTEGTMRLSFRMSLFNQTEDKQLETSVADLENDVQVRKLGPLSGRAMSNIAWVSCGIVGAIAMLGTIKQLGWLSGLTAFFWRP